MLFIILLISLFATVPNLGFFSLPAVLLLVLVLAVSLIYFFKKDLLTNHTIDNSHFIFFFIILCYSLFYYGGIYQQKDSFQVAYLVFFILIGTSFFYFFMKKSVLQDKTFFWLLIVIYLCLSLWTIGTSPSPTVDSFVILKEAPMKILHGINPYQANFTQVYEGIAADYYPYLPFSFIFVLPFRLILGDPRYASIFFSILSVLIFKKIFKNADSKALNAFSGSFLFLPRSFFVLEHMYLDPIVFFLFITFYYYFKEKKFGVSLFFLGIFFGFKQYLVLLLPLFWQQVRKVLPKYYRYFFLPFTLFLFFLILAPSKFIDNIVTFYFTKQSALPIRISLSVPTLLANIGFSRNIASLIGILFFGAIYSFIFKKKWLLTEKIFIVLLTFNIFSSISFFNHYYLTFNFLLFAIMENTFSTSKR